MAGGSAVALSIVCVIISSLTTTFGLFFQKIALERSLLYSENYEDVAAVCDPAAFKRKTRLIWFAGFLCITLFSFVLDLYSMATLGQSLVVPLLASLEVAENQIFAPIVLKEKFDRVKDTLASVVVIIGALCTTLFGPGGPMNSSWSVVEVLTYDEQKAQFGELFSATTFLIFESIAVIICIICLILSRVEACRMFRFLMVSYVAGFLGGQQNLFLKGVGTFMGVAFSGDGSVFADWLVYVFIVGMVGLASTQLAFLNYGLAKFPALLFVPAYTILYIVSGTLVGLLFYQEYKLMSTVGWIMFSIGIVFIGLAMVILSTKEVKDDVVPVEEAQIKVTDTEDNMVKELSLPTPPPYTPALCGIGGEGARGDALSKPTQDHVPPTPCSLHTIKVEETVASISLSLTLERSQGSKGSGASISRSHSKHQTLKDLVHIPTSTRHDFEAITCTSHCCLGSSGGALFCYRHAP